MLRGVGISVLVALPVSTFRGKPMIPSGEGKLKYKNPQGRQWETTLSISFPRNMASRSKRKPTTSTGPPVNRASAGGVASGTGSSKAPRIVIQRNPCKGSGAIKIGTLNVRTLLRKGKLDNVKQEMIKNNLNVLGLSEVRWKEEGDFDSDEYRVCYAGGEESQRGVAIVLDKETSKRVTEVNR